MHSTLPSASPHIPSDLLPSFIVCLIYFSWIFYSNTRWLFEKINEFTSWFLILIATNKRLWGTPVVDLRLIITTNYNDFISNPSILQTFHYIYIFFCWFFKTIFTYSLTSFASLLEFYVLLGTPSNCFYKVSLRAEAWSIIRCFRNFL